MLRTIQAIVVLAFCIATYQLFATPANHCDALNPTFCSAR
jgi:hypothetical protein